MYNIIQLNDKDLSELQSIAKELGIKNADSLKKDKLVYDILDEQAVRNAAKKAAPTTSETSCFKEIVGNNWRTTSEAFTHQCEEGRRQGIHGY